MRVLNVRGFLPLRRSAPALDSLVGLRPQMLVDFRLHCLFDQGCEQLLDSFVLLEQLLRQFQDLVTVVLGHRCRLL